jgi:cell filamentation protein, protein adenylyltransferase
MNKGLLSLPILYLSKYIINNKESYYHYINGVSNHGDWKRWMLYMLTAVDETANFTVMKIEEITQQIEATRNHIGKHFPNLDFAVIELKHVGNENVYINHDLVRILENP